MFRAVRWALVALGLVIFVGGGMSIFARPAHEILYDLQGPTGSCGASGCVGLYTLHVGNTGRAPQGEVRVRLRAAVIDTALLAPRVRDFGKFDRAVNIGDGDGIRTYTLGLLKPEDRVELSFVLQRRDRSDLPAWKQVLVAVEAPEGAVRVGDPGWAMLLRLWYAIFSTL